MHVTATIPKSLKHVPVHVHLLHPNLAQAVECFSPCDVIHCGAEDILHCSALCSRECMQSSIPRSRLPV